VTRRPEATIVELAVAWGLELLPEPTGGHDRVVEARTRDGVEVVLKLPAPSARPAATQLALRAWDGRGAPEVLAFDEESGALLLERVRPGTVALDSTAAEAARLLEMLHVDAPATLPSLDELVGRRIDAAERESRASRPRIAWARKALDRLGADGMRPALVHGRLDERNVLRCDRRDLCAIDPDPCVGDSAYDAACWVHAGGSPGRRTRFDALCGELELDQARLRDWCGVVAVHD
jgi:streptomycin 6-kinase